VKVVMVKMDDGMKAALDALRLKHGVNMRSFIRLAVAKALKRRVA
jgi:hypothetical protein